MSLLNKYKHWGFKILMLEDDYWDFCLSKDTTPSIPYRSRLTERCLSSYINFLDDKCYDEDGVCSYDNYIWQDSINTGVVLEDIGLTGIDNGRIYYGGWEKVSNQEFYNILTNSKLKTEKNDYRLHLAAVTGNTGLHSFPMERDPEEKFYSLKGGFFQGFYKLHGFDYQVIPQYIDRAWHVEMTFRPRDYEIPSDALNSIYPDNAGIFFYMGTRAEDKFLQLANTDLTKYEEREQPDGKLCDYFDDGYFLDSPRRKEEDKKAFNKRKAVSLHRFLTEYGYRWYSRCGCCPGKKKKEDEYIDPCDANGYLSPDTDYFEPDIKIDGKSITTSDGKSLSDTGYYEIETDNKFLTFNRTKYGFTTSNWDENTLVVLTGSTEDFHTGNLFLLMNRTKNGYTTETIDEYYSSVKTKEYDFMKSVMGNSFALQYNPDGSISYKYLVKDCDSEEGYSVISESTYSGLVKDNEWTTVNVKFAILNGYLDNCGVPVGQRKMKIYIYINGYLKLVSKELPEFNFRELDTVKEKQEGVPFNISVGGGTQGLCDSVWVDYNKAFEKILPIERNFAGTFIGDIKSFKFYDCPLEYAEIKNNYLYEKL